MAEKNIKGITIEIGGDVQPLQKALKDVNSTSKNLQDELKSVERLLKLDPKNTELLAQKQKLLSDAIGNTSDKLKTLKEAERQAGEQFRQGNIGEEQYRAIQREVVATEQELKKLKTSLDDINNKWKNAATSIGDFGKKTEELGNKLMPVSAAAGAALAGVVGIGIQAAGAADDLNTLSKTTGLSTETLQKFSIASDTIDVSMDTLTGSLSKLTKNMSGAKDGTGTAAESFQALGVSITDSNGMLRDNEDVFNDTINALGNVANETERDALAMNIFGKSAQELNPLILGGADALKEMGDAAEQKGLILSQEELDRANELNDTLDMMKAETLQELMSLGSQLAPILIPFFEKLGSVISGVIGWFTGLDDGTKKMILTMLAVIAGVAPVLIIIGKIATGISALMSVISAVGPVIAILTGPIGLVIAAVAAAIAIGVLLYKNWDQIKQFAQNLWSSLTTTFTNLKASIVGILSGLPAQMLGFGRDIINGLINGIKEKVGAVADAVKNIAGTITGKIKSILGIHSPSTVLEEMGENTGQGFVNGISNMVGAVKSQAQDLSSAAMTSSKGTSGTNATASAGNQSQTINVTINNPVAEASSESTRKQLTRLAYMGVV